MVGEVGNSDPAGLIDGLNLFVFARDNPVRLIDTTGHQANKADGGMSDDEVQAYLKAGYPADTIKELSAQKCRSVIDYCKKTFF